MANRIAAQPTTVTLCLLCVLITLAHSTSGASDGTAWSRLGHFTDVTPFDIWNGKHFPLFTSMFLHSDFTQGLGITHLLFDVIWLYQLGCLVELSIGPVWYLLFIAAAAGVGSCAELAWSSDVSIGASGVVYALFGFMWAGRYRYTEWQALATKYNLQIMIGWGVFCIAATYFGWMNIANGAHFGGLAFGYSLGMLLFSRRYRWAWLAPLAGLLALCGMAITYLPWSWEWLAWRGDKTANAQQFTRAVSFYTRAIEHGAPAKEVYGVIAAAWHEQEIKDADEGNYTAAERDLEQEEIAADKSGGSNPGQ